MQLSLFTTDLTLAVSSEGAGIDSIIVDWETKCKDKRQKGYDLETNGDTPEDIYKLSKVLNIPVTVRVNCIGEHTPSEVDCALENGARILMLPVAETIEQVQYFLDIVKSRAKTIIQIETLNLAAKTEQLAKLNWDYAYIGLNDLMISRGGNCVWEPVFDGTVESICSSLRGREYGFGGVTILGGGDPLSIDLLLHEYTRLGCSLCFLRRAFKKEILDRNISAEIKAIRAFIAASSLRGPKAKLHDHQRLCKQIERYMKTENSNIEITNGQKYSLNV